MASADITAKETRVKGVNQDTNYEKQNAYVIDCEEHTGLLAVDTHDVIALPKGELLTGLKIVVLKGAASSGSATVKFSAKFNAASEDIASAIEKSDLAAGDVIDLPLNKIKGYDADYGAVIQMTVGTAALTAFKFMVIAETVPVTEFLTRG